MNCLPIELIDHIIDFHHSDKPTLKICSSVCRKWLFASRFHLYRAVHLRASNVSSFVRLLASPSSTIANYVHTLHIYMHYAYAVPVIDFIAPYLVEFVAVESISIEGRQQLLVSDESLSRDFGRIGNMELTRVADYFQGPSFSTTFTLGNGDCSGPFNTFSSRLRVLRSALDDASAPLSWLPIAAQPPAVGEVDISGIEGVHLPTVQATLKSGGQSVHTIRLSFSLPRYTTDLIRVCDYLDLTHNTNLRSLSILDLNISGLADYGSFYAIIERISSFHLTHLRIGIWVFSHTELAWLECKKVAEELNFHRFAELQQVCIDIGFYLPDDDGDKMIAWVRDEMSCLDNRGILTVDCS